MEIKLSFTVAKNAAGELEIVAIATDAEGKEVGRETLAVKAEGVVVETELTTANASLEESKTLLEASRNSYAQLETELAAEKAKSAELEATVAGKTAELEAANTRLAEIDAAAAETARVARLEARLAELPESYREAHSKREDAKRAELETEWSTMADEVWAAKLEDINLALPKGGVITASYLERSRREGLLALGNVPTIEASSIAERCQKFTRKSR